MEREDLLELTKKTEGAISKSLEGYTRQTGLEVERLVITPLSGPGHQEVRAYKVSLLAKK